MPYVDGFVIPVPEDKIKAYQKVARAAGKIWMEYGALDYWECVGDDLKNDWGVPFPKMVKTKPGETVLFSWIVYKSRAHRNQVNAKIMKDERIAKLMEPSKQLFDCKKMVYGGFKPIVRYKK
jgi:uncharacterized protein YbaA (DUF1428 family)